ncbi:uncharacterized protein [Aegilops tauschii subsp. strangulata]|uniref:uncharacterized protein n=1 Tax=Aegilops tauschii subsp. strangulata TaxID=200361 RepID=UPI003CC87452
MSNITISLMNWNIRGLNSPAKRATICESASAHSLALLCLQATKIDTWTQDIVREIGGGRLDNCDVLPAVGTRGRATIFWDSSKVVVATHLVGQFSITASVSQLHTNTSFWLTTVYDPADEARKDEFLDEMIRIRPPQGEPWLINGDFNIIYEARDKSNHNLNRRVMGRFRDAIDRASLREIKCQNRRFTWSNERENPTFLAIDKVFSNQEWEALFPALILMAAFTSCLDHYHLLLTGAAVPPRKAWQRPVNHSCLFTRMKIKLKRTAADLKIWAKSIFSDTKLQFHIASEVVLRLDVAQEKLQLTPREFWLRKTLKLKIVGLASLERAFYQLAGGDFAALNRAIIVMLPKQSGATKLTDFRPISLIHSVAKLIAKVVSIRLVGVLDQLVSPSQSAFQKKKGIHDSFLYVQNTIRMFQRKKSPALLLKIDIAKAFDLVSWEYLLELLQRFPSVLEGLDRAVPLLYVLGVHAER